MKLPKIDKFQKENFLGMIELRNGMILAIRLKIKNIDFSTLEIQICKKSEIEDNEYDHDGTFNKIKGDGSIQGLIEAHKILVNEIIPILKRRKIKQLYIFPSDQKRSRAYNRRLTQLGFRQFCTIYIDDYNKKNHNIPYSNIIDYVLDFDE